MWLWWVMILMITTENFTDVTLACENIDKDDETDDPDDPDVLVLG